MKLKITAAAVLLLSIISCHRDIVPEEEGAFTALIEDSVITKTSVKDMSIAWEEGDAIAINGIEFTATPGRKNPKKAEFRTISQEMPSGPFKAISPASLIIDKEASDYYYLPSELTYKKGVFNLPMFAKSDTRSLVFKVIFGVIKIDAPADGIKSISVSSDLDMNGLFHIDEEDGQAKIIEESGASKSTTIICPSNLSELKEFYIPVPPGDYTGKNLKVVLTLADDSKETMSMEPYDIVDIKAGHIYNMTNFQMDGTFIIGNGELQISSADDVL